MSFEIVESTCCIHIHSYTDIFDVNYIYKNIMNTDIHTYTMLVFYFTCKCPNVITLLLKKKMWFSVGCIQDSQSKSKSSAWTTEDCHFMHTKYLALELDLAQLLNLHDLLGLLFPITSPHCNILARDITTFAS